VNIMSDKTGFIKSTLVGGIVFLVPIVILIAVIGKAFEIMKQLAAPLAAGIPVDSIGGLAVANLVAIAAIVLFCFLAGLVARTRPARSFVKSLESRLLSRLPAYAFIKGMTEKIAGIKNAGGLTPVLARSGGGWRMAFEIERIDNGNVAVYLPGAPNPWSGFVCFMAEADVKPLDLPVKSVLDTFESFGKGSGELLKDRL
jgi:uncharacterized membrane protein